MNAARRFRLADGVLAQTVLVEAVLLDARKGHYFGANVSASVILRGVIEGHSEAQIVAELAQQFEADHALLETDTQHCLADWLTRGLIVEIA